MLTCVKCSNPPKKKFWKGQFKGYLKTCEEHFLYHHKPGPDHYSASKNGRRITPEGYVQVLDPKKSHVKTGSRYSLEHRLVIKEVLGRELDPKEVVHHANGIRHDNRPENLILLGPNEYHESRTYTKALQKRIRELEAQLCAENIGSKG